MKTLLPKLIPAIAIAFIFSSCGVKDIIDPVTESPKTGQFYEYIIRKGQHYADYNAFQAVQYSELKFITKFDNTAQYTTTDPANQEDINKLYGFSDNNAEHQQFSARLGWNWARGALRLYAYVYNNGVRDSKEIMAIQPGTEYNCSIKVVLNKYIFSVGDVKVEMHRASSTTTAAGYKLYPYFGGDETAPHDVHILIKEL